MNSHTKKRIYTAWTRSTIPDHAKHNLEENIKINNCHWYILCYDKHHIQGSQCWKDLLERLNNYSNFKAQEINARDIFDDEEDFLHPTYKTMFDLLDNVERNGDTRYCSAYIKEFLISLSVTRNRNTAWININCKSVTPISFSSIHGIKQMPDNSPLFTSYGTVVGYNNSSTLITYLFVLDVIELFLKIHKEDLITKSESIVGFAYVLIALDGIHTTIQFIVLSTTIKSPENSTSSLYECFRNLSIMHEEIEIQNPSRNRSSNSNEEIETQNPSRNSKFFREETWHDSVRVSNENWEMYFSHHDTDDFIPELPKNFPIIGAFSLFDTEMIIQRKQYLTKNLHITPVFPYGVKTYQGFFTQRELSACNAACIFKSFLNHDIKIYLMLFMYKSLRDLSSFNITEGSHIYTSFKEFCASNPNYTLEHTEIKLQHILYPMQNHAPPNTDLQSPSAEKLDQTQRINEH